MRPLLIERPERQSVTQRWGYSLLTLAFWGVFIYFLRPVLTLAVWVIGYWRFHDVMIESHGIEHLASLLLIYLLIILGMSLSLVGWGFYNLMRYGRHEKRITQPESSTPEMLAEYFMVEPDDVRTWQDTKCLVIHFDSSGRIVNADCLPEVQASYDPDKDTLNKRETPAS